MYYLGTREKRPGQRHLYVVRDPAADDPRHFEPLCVTCDLGEVLWSSRQVCDSSKIRRAKSVEFIARVNANTSIAGFIIRIARISVPLSVHR